MIKFSLDKTQARWLYWSLLILIALTYLIFAGLILNVSRKNAIETLHADNIATLNTQANQLKSELQKFLLIPTVLSESSDVISALNSGAPQTITDLNEKLESLAKQTNASYIFVFDATGTTVASSNYNSDDSFVGKSYSFRPYIHQAIETGSAQYFAKGETTGKAGLFLAGRISDDAKALGGVVVKVEFNEITKDWNQHERTTLVSDENSIILFSNDPSLNYKTLSPLSPSERSAIISSKQFGDEPLKESGFEMSANSIFTNKAGHKLLIDQVSISDFNWILHRLLPIKPSIQNANLRAHFIIFLVGISLAAIGLFFRARVKKEREKEAVTQYLKTEVARQTQNLSIANDQLKLEFLAREQINVRFRAAREELAQANRLGSIGAITASVAHELNQPVAAIRARAENAIKLLQRGDHTRVDENLDLIVSLTARIGSISTELRRYARRGSHSVMRVSINDVIDGVKILMGDRLRTEGIKLTIESGPGKVPDVKVGRVRLEQVLVNLLQNASDALKGQPEPRIHIGIKTSNTDVVITVADNGIGIKEDIVKNIFTPFFTDKPQGMGMGLGIAKEIMTDFAGSIKVIPSHLGGAAFELTLPIFQ